MNTKLKTKISRRLSLILRHKPESIGLQLDNAGWADVQDLLSRLNKNGLHLTLKNLKEIVSSNDKQRFRFSEDGLRICANQGHSIKVDLALTAQKPPSILYHGTASHSVGSILSHGLTKQSRHAVHLTEDIPMTMKVASRRGAPVLIKINAEQMHHDGYLFYLTANNVWLIESVPSAYLTIDQS